MKYQNFSTAKSLLDCVKHLQSDLEYGEKIIFLTGNSGSGRTSVCEHIVNALDETFSTVFIPCQREMSIERLRQLFLQQAAPADKWDETVPLYQSFKSLSIPVRQKLLVVIDNIDDVITTFSDEVFELFSQFLGQNRFSFLITSHPLWAQAKISSSLNDKLEVKEYEIPKISMQESLEISRQLFEHAGLEKVYNVILPKLPNALEACDGNLGRIIKLTETFMADPIEVEKDQQNQNVDKNVSEVKKHSSTGIFIAIVCVVIVLACLIPVFLGTNVVDRLFGKTPAEDPAKQKVEVSTSIADPAANKLTFGDERDKKDQSVSDDPLAVSAGSISDIKANGPKGSEKEAVHDEGGLLPKVEGGVEAEEVKSTTKNSVTLQGEALEAIEGKGADSKSDDPRRGLAGSLNKQDKLKSEKETAVSQSDKIAANKTEKADKSEAAPLAVLKRENSILYKDKIQKEDEAIALKRKADEEAAIKLAQAQEQAKKDLAAKEKAKQKAEAKAAEVKETAQTPKKKEPVSSGIPVKRNSRAYLGENSEIDSMNSNHYTLQVLAGTDKSALQRAATYIDGKYWIYSTVRNGRAWHVLITGDFASPRAAVDASRAFPASIRKAGPFAKTFDKVKTEMRLQ